jgi:hypothetical protein
MTRGRHSIEEEVTNTYVLEKGCGDVTPDLENRLAEYVEAATNPDAFWHALSDPLRLHFGVTYMRCSSAEMNRDVQAFQDRDNYTHPPRSMKERARNLESTFIWVPSEVRFLDHAGPLQAAEEMTTSPHIFTGADCALKELWNGVPIPDPSLASNDIPAYLVQYHNKFVLLSGSPWWDLIANQDLLWSKLGICVPNNGQLCLQHHPAGSSEQYPATWTYGQIQQRRSDVRRTNWNKVVGAQFMCNPRDPSGLGLGSTDHDPAIMTVIPGKPVHAGAMAGAAPSTVLGVNGVAAFVTLCDVPMHEVHGEVHAHMMQTTPIDFTIGVMDCHLTMNSFDDKLFLFVDTGATDHVIYDGRCLTQKDQHKRVNIRIRTGNGVSMATSYGPATFIMKARDGQDVELTRTVIYCPEFSANLFSVGKDWKDHQSRTRFEDELSITLSTGATIPFDKTDDNSFRLTYRPKEQTGRKTGVQATAHNISLCNPASTPTPSFDQKTLWHQRLGHLSFEKVAQLHRTTTGTGIPPDRPWFTQKEIQAYRASCIDCPLAHMKSAPHKQHAIEAGSRSRATLKKLPRLATQYGDSVHMDLAGPFPESFHYGYRYESLFVDQHSLYIGLYVLKTKDEHIDAHKRYCSEHAPIGGMEIKHFHSDNGGEFISNEYKELILEGGSLKTTIVPKTPSHNPIAEGMFYRINSVIRALVTVEAGLPPEHWAAGALQAAYILNRVPRHRDGKWTTSYEMVRGRPPCVRHIKRFGCLVYCLINKTDRDSKISAVSKVGFHMGVSRYKRGWLVFIPGSNGGYVASHNVRFFEHLLYRDVQNMLPRIVSRANGEDDNAPEDTVPSSPATTEQPGKTFDVNDKKVMSLTDDPWKLIGRGNRIQVMGSWWPDVPDAQKRAVWPCELEGYSAGYDFGPGDIAPAYFIQNQGYFYPMRTEDVRKLLSAKLKKQAKDADSQLPSSTPRRTNRRPANNSMMAGVEEPASREVSGDHDTFEHPKPNASAAALATAVEAAEMLDEDDVTALRTRTLHGEDGAVMHEVSIPKNLKEAQASPEWPKWKEACLTELASHKKRQTWKLVPASTVPRGRKIIGSTWVFDVKRDSKGMIQRYKARLVAQGFNQIKGIDFINTYSNTARSETLRTVCAVSARGHRGRSLRLTGIDVVTAYLFAQLEQQVREQGLYMRQPRGFESEGDEVYVCSLDKAIYGLSQSGARWESRLAEALHEMNFAQNEVDPCLWKLSHNDEIIYACYYVDDVLFASSCDKLRDRVVSDLEKKFELKDTGDVSYFLGISVRQDLEAKTVTMSQELYIEGLIHQLLKGDSTTRKGRVTPCSDDIMLLDKLAEGEPPHPDFHSSIGKLGWLAKSTRPDICFAYSMLARFQSCGGEAHMAALRNVVRYLERTKHYCITYSAAGEDELHNHIQSHSTSLGPDILESVPLIVFVDAAHGGEKPPAGYVGFLGGGPIMWSCNRLPMTSLSSCQGEYVAAATAARETLGLRDELVFMGIKMDMPTIILNDNKGAVQLADNNTSSKRMKHIATRIYFLRECVEEKHIQLHHMSTTGMIADIFTKPLPAHTFHALRELLVA